MINTVIEDGYGTGLKARVNGHGELVTSVLPYPARVDADETRVYRQFLTDDGTASGSSDLRVNGSSTPLDFSVLADEHDDIYINEISFKISDAGAALNEFGNLSALTNGCDLFYEDLLGFTTIADELKTNFDFIRLCSGSPAFGDAATAFRANNVVGSSEAYIPVLSFSRFGIPYGLRLRAGTTQRLCIRINDNVTALDAFDAICYGFRRLNGR